MSGQDHTRRPLAQGAGLHRVHAQVRRGKLLPRQVRKLVQRHLHDTLDVISWQSRNQYDQLEVLQSGQAPQMLMFMLMCALKPVIEDICNCLEAGRAGVVRRDHVNVAGEDALTVLDLILLKVGGPELSDMTARVASPCRRSIY